MAENKQYFSIFNSKLALIGAVIAVIGLLGTIFLSVLDHISGGKSPYLSLFSLVLSPLVFVTGMIIYGIGWIIFRKKISKTDQSPQPFAVIDFSKPAHRRGVIFFVVGGVAIIFLTLVAAYHGYHFAESVYFCGQLCHTPMKPEYTAYIDSPHAKVSCTECHVGSGTANYIKAKLNGIHQLVATVSDSYHRPIPTPVENLPMTQDSCENCHWPKKYIGELNRTFTRYLSDDDNTPVTIQMLLKVGGGDPTHGPVGGIHWHMNIANKIEFVSTDDKRQTIPWVRMTDSSGKSIEFVAGDFKFDPTKHKIKTMDCLDCHNRPAHQFMSPSDALDNSFAQSRLDAKIKGLKKTALEIFSKDYKSDSEAFSAIENTIKTTFKDLDANKQQATVEELKKIYSRNFFPEMKASWKAYPNNIGHKEWPGCFRCHDGQHKTADGKKKIESSNCNDCHIIVAQSKAGHWEPQEPKPVTFKHPDESSDGTEANCNMCHGGSL